MASQESELSPELQPVANDKPSHPHPAWYASAAVQPSDAIVRQGLAIDMPGLLTTKAQLQKILEEHGYFEAEQHRQTEIRSNVKAIALAEINAFKQCPNETFAGRSYSALVTRMKSNKSRVKSEQPSQKRQTPLIDPEDDSDSIPPRSNKIRKGHKKHRQTEPEMPKANPHAGTLPHYIKSEVTLSACTVHISRSSNAAVTRFRLQAIVKDEFRGSTDWTLDSLSWNKLVLKATASSGAFYPVDFNTECLWDSFGPVRNEEELATAISDAINSGSWMLKLEVRPLPTSQLDRWTTPDPFPNLDSVTFTPTTPRTNIRKPVATRTSASSGNNATLTDPPSIHTSVPDNSNQPVPSVAETTTVGGKDTVMGGTSEKGDADVSNSQPPPLTALADTTELYEIEKIVRVEKNGTNVTNAIEVLSDNSSDDEDDGDPLPDAGDEGQNDFEDHAHEEEENDPNATFFGRILNSGFNQAMKKECERIDETLWSETCRCLRLDPNANLDADSLPLPLWPVAKSFKPKKCQLIATHYQTINEKYDVNGGVCADQMGLGKTVTAILAHLLNRLIVINQQAVQDSRAKNDGLHLTRSAGEAKNAQCPSQDSLPIWCTCVDENPYSALERLDGPTLVIAPPKALLAWKKNIKLVFGENYSATMRENMGKNKGIADIQFRIIHGDYVKTAWECRKGDPKFLLSYKEPNPDDPNNESYNPPTDSSRFIVATTVGCWKQRFLLSLGEILPGARYRSNAVAWLHVFLDEFHATKNSQTQLWTITRQLAIQALPNNIYLWGYSGTPAGTGPGDLAAFLQTLAIGREDEWAEKPDRKLLLSSNIYALQAKMNKMVRMKAELSKEAEKEMGAIIDGFRDVVSQFVIGRSMNTRWFNNEPLIKINARRVDWNIRVKYTPEVLKRLNEATDELKKEIDAAYAKKLAEWERKGSNANQKPTKPHWSSSAFAHKLRIFADFPELQLWKNKGGDFDVPFTGSFLEGDKKKDYMLDHYKNPKQSIFKRELPSIVASSPKMDALKTVLAQLGTNCKGHPEKLVVFTAFPIAAFIIHLYLLNRYGPGNCELVSGKLKMEERESIVEEFENYPTPRFLVSTTGLMSEAYTLIGTSKVFMFEPQPLPAVEAQAFGRAYRIGQLEDEVTDIRAASDEVDIEVYIQQRAKKREIFTLGAFSRALKHHTKKKHLSSASPLEIA